MALLNLVVLLFSVSILDGHPELKAVDEQTDDELVHFNGLRETDRLAHQALDPRAQRQMFPLQLLGIVFPHYMESRSQMPLVSSLTIRVKAGDPKRREQRLQLEKRLIFASPEHIGQYLAGAVIQRVPQPARSFFLTDKGPHFVDFGGLYRRDTRLRNQRTRKDCWRVPQSQITANRFGKNLVLR